MALVDWGCLDLIGLGGAREQPSLELVKVRNLGFRGEKKEWKCWGDPKSFGALFVSLLW